MMTAYSYAVVIIKNGKLYGFSAEYYQMAIATEEGMRWLKLYDILQVCGQFSFPIFLFFIAEGFIHTASFSKYFARVFIMAAIAEIPFDLCFFNQVSCWSVQNPAFSLSLALLVLKGMQKCRKHPFEKWMCMIFGAAAAYIAHLQYGVYAVITAALLVNFRKEKTLRMVCGALLTLLFGIPGNILSVLSYIPLWFYNGDRGRVPLKWLFYLYYPLHYAGFYAMIYIGAMLTN